MALHQLFPKRLHILYDKQWLQRSPSFLKAPSPLPHHLLTGNKKKEELVKKQRILCFRWRHGDGGGHCSANKGQSFWITPKQNKNAAAAKTMTSILKF